MPGDSNIPLYLFAKAPVPGQVKTRMAPSLSPQRSAALASLMLTHSLSTISTVWPGRVVLTVSPDSSHPVFQHLNCIHSIEFSVQIDSDLGGRMAHVLAQGVQDSGAAVVMGCDVPYFDGSLLVRAHDMLEQGLDVVGPAEDGGFYLLGLHHFDTAIFRDIQWGTSSVLQDVNSRAEQVGMTLSRIATLRDIDNWSDLVWLAERDARYQQFVS